MDTERKIEIGKAILAQLENNMEAAVFEGRICSKVSDEKGLENVKKRIEDLQKRVDAANDLLKDIEKGE